MPQITNIQTKFQIHHFLIKKRNEFLYLSFDNLTIRLSIHYDFDVLVHTLDTKFISWLVECLIPIFLNHALQNAYFSTDAESR